MTKEEKISTSKGKCFEAANSFSNVVLDVVLDVLLDVVRDAISPASKGVCDGGDGVAMPLLADFTTYPHPTNVGHLF